MELKSVRLEIPENGNIIVARATSSRRWRIS